MYWKIKKKKTPEQRDVSRPWNTQCLGSDSSGTLRDYNMFLTMSNLFTTKLIYILLTWKEKPEYLKEYSFFNMSGEQKKSNFFWTEKEEKILFILNK